MRERIVREKRAEGDGMTRRERVGKVMLVDAWRRRRRRAHAAFAGSSGWEVAAESSTEDAGEVLDLVRTLSPETVLVGLGGAKDAEIIELCREIKELPDPPKVLIYGEWQDGFAGPGEHGELAFVFSLADAFVSGDTPTERLPRTLQDVLAGT